MWPSIIILFLLLVLLTFLGNYLLLYSTFLKNNTIDFSDETELKTITSYVCPGQEAVFRCIVHGGVTTRWQGSALQNCSDGSVILRHSQFGNGLAINKTCGTSGAVVGQPISAENGSYISQLAIFAHQGLNGSIIECATGGGFLASRIQVLLITGAKFLILFIFN